MKRLICALLCVILLASCTPAVIDKPASSADGVAKYTAFLEERLEKMPEELTIATAEASATYGVDMSDFADDGYLIRAEAGEVLILGKTDAGLDRAVREYVKNGNDQNFFKVYNEGYRVKKLTIAGNDISEYAIVRDDDADASQTAASSELAKYIALTCGAVLPEYTASEYASASDKPVRTITFTVDYPALGDEAFTIEIGDDANVTISGGRYRGCIYGTYDLLNDIGWRFAAYADDSGFTEYLYESEYINLTAELNRTESSPFTFRKAYGGYIGLNYQSEKYKEHSRTSFGARLTDVACHGLSRNHNSIFYEGYYYGLNVDYVQPCMTDEIVLEYIEEYVVRCLESTVASGKYQPEEVFMVIDLSQWDCSWDAFCQCKLCREVVAEEGAISGPWVRMANQNAALAKEMGFTDVWISLLAYVGSEVPPKKTAPLDNVRISYAFYPWACGNHTLSGEDCDTANLIYTKGNSVYHKNFIGWREICTNNNLDVWYYPLYWGDATLSGVPILGTMYECFRYLADHGVAGIMALSSDSMIGYFSALLMWDPYMTREEFDAFVREWFAIIYGDAGDPLYEYYRTLENGGKTQGCFNTIHGGLNSDIVAKNIYNKDYICENIYRILKFFDEAYALASSEREESLVLRYRTSMLFICIGCSHEEMYTNGTDEERDMIATLYKEMYENVGKYNFRTGMGEPYVLPEELDVSVNPFDWYL